ncbi:MAG: hypothetical protein JXA35_07800 [Deltaproteobacteria bacterium]|nr:hypothetical protein [Deltaproteobacteria bacterium]
MSNYNKEIRSTLDIVMERAQMFGSLSTEESRRLKEKELMIAGEALSKRFLEGLPLREIELEMQKREGDDKRKVTEYMLSGLVDSLDIEKTDEAEMALAGIRHFSGNSDAAEKVKTLISEYRNVLKRALRENIGRLTELRMQELKEIGICGSAVEALPENSPEWLNIKDSIASDFNNRLAVLTKIWKR